MNMYMYMYMHLHVYVPAHLCSSTVHTPSCDRVLKDGH